PLRASRPHLGGRRLSVLSGVCDPTASGLHTMAAMTRTEQLRSQLLGYRPTDVWGGWLAPLFVAAVGGFLRFWQLGRPHQLVFDETYYVKQGYSFLKYGYEREPRHALKNPAAPL